MFKLILWLSRLVGLLLFINYDIIYYEFLKSLPKA